jgi:hypothetical protein
MALQIRQTTQGWTWLVIAEGGASSGIETSLARAKIEVYIAESLLLGYALPESVTRQLRKNPEKFAVGFPEDYVERLRLSTV